MTAITDGSEAGKPGAGRMLHDRRHDHDAPIDGLSDQTGQELIRYPRPAHYPPDT